MGDGFRKTDKPLGRVFTASSVRDRLCNMCHFGPLLNLTFRSFFSVDIFFLQTKPNAIT